MDIALASLGIALPLGTAAAVGYLLGRDRLWPVGATPIESAIAAQLATAVRYGASFSVAIFETDLAEPPGRRRKLSDNGDTARHFDRLLADCARETDIVVAYGERARLVVMPQTDLAGACALGERVRAEAAQRLPTTLSGGVTQALDGDTPESLLGRTGEALRAARQAGGNRVDRHDGRRTEPVLLAPHEAESPAEVGSA
jgi:PleD family two-component response regulator